MALRCCPTCRLLDEEASCALCGEATLLYTRPKVVTRSPNSVSVVMVLLGLACFFVTGFVVLSIGSLLPKWLLGPFLWLGMLLAFLSIPLAGIFERKTREPLKPLPSPPREGERVRGHARRDFGTKEATIARALIARDGDGVYLRRMRPVKCLVESDGAAILVTGHVELRGDGDPTSPTHFGPWAEDLPRLEYVELRVNEGDEVEVIGAIAEEPATDGYRERKQRVMRGTTARPVVMRRM